MWRKLSRGAQLGIVGTLLFPGWLVRAQNPAPVGELFPSDTGEPQQAQAVGTGMPVVAGSEVSAGIAPARFRLGRGGQVRICPRTSIGVNAGSYGFMFTMGSGSVEIDYRTAPRMSDVLLTPDFSVRMLGPGVYHFALGVDKQGATCFKSLPGNSSMVAFSELLGSDVYKAGPGQGLVFSSGKLSTPKPLIGECGCPVAPPALVASVPVPRAGQPVKSGNPAAAGGPAMMAHNEPTAPLPGDKPGQVHIEVDTPFVFNARSDAVEPYSVARINFSSLPNMLFLQEKADPIVLKKMPAQVSTGKEPIAQVTAPGQKQEKHEKAGFFSRLKGFFGSIFHH